ncbi:hypothetical protein MKO06_08250 [Gramella sp. GC03-9]|uniref:Uncharacterized protein n=1 Tax=Christiangramia oceanisediminis TaxID=2920386 RepID=A0A9X2IBI6_9FLAO|nr:hypothetical protein [Gramella oceanisediminis]MCP9199893.1 hypothetical protein [Gramella oceanisediminis]
MKKNVLVAGIGQANYIMQLYGEIAPKLPGFSFNAFNLKDFGDKQIEVQAVSVFNRVYFFKPDLKNILTLSRAIVPVLLNRYFWKDLTMYIAEKGNIFSNGGLRLFLRHVNAYYYANFIDRKTDTDIIHLHFPKHIFALFLKYLKKDYEEIWTYWGSDIYRIDSWIDHEIQNSSLDSVDLITMATPEMEFTLLSRFGFQYKYKIRRARFLHDSSYYELAANLISNSGWEKGFKTDFNIPPEKIIILFGHNGHFENNHIQFLETLSKLPENIANEFHVIFPFTYGDHKKGYLQEVKKISEEISTSFQFIEDFMDWEELAKLKIISDVYIHCPTTDGLSAFLTEFLYTNNLAIVGSWLPYNTFRDFGLYYKTFDNFESLREILISLKDNIKITADHRSSNQKVISDNFSIDKISGEWVRVFKEFEIKPIV